jgi:hypothetical protein
VAKVVAIRGFDDVPLQVFADPEPWSKGRGARGHCGIAGLARGYAPPKGTAEKNTLKRIRSELIDAGERMNESSDDPSVLWRAVEYVCCAVARRVAR